MPKGKNAAALFEMIGGSRAADGAPTATRTPSWWWKRPAASNSAAPPTPPATPSAPAGPMIVVDHDHQMVHFSLSTTASIVIAFGLLVLICIAFLIGEHVGKKHGAMTAITTEELMKSAPNPNVMQLPPGAGSPTEHADQTPVPDDQSAPQQQSPEQTLNQPVSADRQIGLNYVIMQSYPPDMRSLATEAQTALLLHGVPCTIEPAPKHIGLGKDWISVIGTTGFTSISSADFKTYVRHIDQANAELHGKFKKLRPLAYKWR